jgi:hypothetical protein
MFSNIEGFTSLTENAGPEQVMNHTSQYFAALSVIEHDRAPRATEPERVSMIAWRSIPQIASTGRSRLSSTPGGVHDTNHRGTAPDPSGC